jgi:hypothetical protein
MFLEALRLYALSGNVRAIRNLLLERDEILIEPTQPDEDPGEFQLRIASLFHRSAVDPTGPFITSEEIRLGEVGEDPAVLQITPKLLRRVRHDNAVASYRYETIENTLGSASESNLIPGLEVSYAGTRRLIPFSVMSASRSRQSFRPEERAEPAFVPARGVSDRELARWWDVAAIRNSEERVLDCLRLISPVERITFVEHPYLRAERVPIVRMHYGIQPVSLKSLGDGMSRMFQIALAIERSRVGRYERLDIDAHLFSDHEENLPVQTPLLLIDEIENGIHYTVHAKLWEMILHLASQYNIQVVATTHSWDCICGLKEAVSKVVDTNAMLIRLEKKNGKDKAVIFQSRELDIIARDEIEVR